MSDIERELRELGLRTGEQLKMESVPVERVARRVRFRKIGAAMGSLALVLTISVGGYAGISAVQNSQATQVNRAVLTAAAAVTEDKGTARIEFDISIRASGGESDGINQDIHGSGVVNWHSGRSHMRSTSKGFPSSENAFTHEVIQDGKTFYFKESDGSLKWDRLDRPRSATAAGFFGQQGSPAGLLDYLRSVARDIKDLGPDHIDGVDVTHYLVTIDPVLGESRARQELPRHMWLDDLDISFQPAEIWIDTDGLVRRFVSSTEIKNVGGPVSSTTTEFVVNLSEFGLPVNIQLPDPEDVRKEPLPTTESEGTSSTEGNDGAIDPFHGLLIMGEKGDHGPTLSILGSDGPFGVCLFGTGDWVTGAEVREAATGEVVAELAGGDPDDLSRPDGLQLTCFPKRFPDDLVDSLKANPSDYVLRLKGEGRTENIELTMAQQGGY